MAVQGMQGAGATERQSMATAELQGEWLSDARRSTRHASGGAREMKHHAWVRVFVIEGKFNAKAAGIGSN